MILPKLWEFGLIEPDDDWRTDEDRAVIDLEWQLQRVGGHPLTHKQVLKADGSTDTLPLPPICVTALRIARRNQDQARTAAWPGTCILTMEIYTQVPDKVTRDALRRLGDWLDHDEDQGDEART